MDFFYSKSDGISLFKNKRDRASIRSLMKVSYEVSPKNEFSEIPDDFFGNLIAKVLYHGNEDVMGIQLYDPDATFYYNTYNLLSMSYGELLAVCDLHSWAYTHDDEGLGVDLEDGNVRLYIPDIDEEGLSAKCKAVYITVPPLPLLNP
jgi:hypothetical protein